MLEILLNTTPVYIAILLGIIFKKKGYGGDKAVDVVSKLAFNIVAPFLIFQVLYGLKFDSSNLNLLISGLSLSILVIPIFILLSKLLHVKRKTEAAIVVSSLGFAVGGFAYPFVLANFDTVIFQNLVLLDMTIFIFVLTIGYAISIFYGEGKDFDIRSVAEKFINPIFIVIIGTFIINYAGIKIPDKILEMVPFFGNSFIFLVSFLMGMTLYLPKLQGLMKIAVIIVARFAVALTVGVLLIRFLPVTDVQATVILLVFMTPFSSMPVVYAAEQKLDVEMASQLAVFSVPVAFIIYPILLSILL